MHLPRSKDPEDGTMCAQRARTTPRHTTTEHMILHTFFATNGHNLPPTCKRFLLATNTSRRATSTQKHDAPLVDGTLANGR